MMGTGNYSDEFKRDAVAQITERDDPIKEVSERLGISLRSPYAWKRKFGKATSRLRRHVDCRRVDLSCSLAESIFSPRG